MPAWQPRQAWIAATDEGARLPGRNRRLGRFLEMDVRFTEILATRVAWLEEKVEAEDAETQN
ncbi:MAG: hypothetical protein H5T66_00250 [Chloroflexi bacterium]|nr:hypothetical protein [Chloroflexota bacterium]